MTTPLSARCLRLATWWFCTILSGACVIATPTWATQAPATVRAAAEQALRQHYALPGSRVEVKSAPLDIRLHLADCHLPLRATIPDYAAPASRMTVQVQCPQAGGWSVRVPLQLQLFRKVLVTNRALLRGDGLHPGDLHAEERDVTRLGYGYIGNPDETTGRILSRPLAAGSVLTPGALGGRRTVRAGDHVQLVARMGGIEVRASGVALGSGDDGARLRVRNDSSGRVIDAMVSAPGVVIALP
ncbi:MAG TPA: flagellar basal body P-ring formation chaperone FlgA [Rhodanobacter sp.]|nr:flagellar basal body P-ring formation chaperone FlgA [Rhodanobacter sp.]